MQESDNYSSCETSPVPSEKSKIIDPFYIGANHENHKTPVIKLEDSGNIFCPLCLEDSVAHRLDKINAPAYQRYVTNLLETVDEHGDKLQLRKVLLPILETVLSRRAFIIERDNDYHEILRIIYKTMKVDKFNESEFSSLIKILSGFSIELIKPFPLKSTWKIWEHLLMYGKKRLDHLKTERRENSKEALKLYRDLARIIKAYLGFLNRKNQIEFCVDNVFLLKDKPWEHTDYYVNSQIKCLEFVSEDLVPGCEVYLSLRMKLNKEMLDLLSMLYSVLNESLTTSIRLQITKFVDWVSKQDFIKKIHLLFKEHKDDTFGSEIYGFLKTLVSYYIKKEYGSDDDKLDALILPLTKPVLTGNAINLDTNNAMFYILLNCVASLNKSQYFVLSRVRNALLNRRSFNNLRRIIFDSLTLTRAYMHLLSKISDPVKDDVAKEVIAHELNLRRSPESSDVFVTLFFNLEILSWVQNYPGFPRTVNQEALGYLIEGSIEKKQLCKCLKILFQGPLKGKCNELFRNDSNMVLQNIVKESDSEERSFVIEKLSTRLPSLLQGYLQDYLDFTDIEHLRSGKCKQIMGILTGLNLMLRECQDFIPLCDDMMENFFRFTVALLDNSAPSELGNKTLVVVFEFITRSILLNTPYLMDMLRRMNSMALGYMYSRLMSTDELTEHIAELLVAYDDLDYPLIYRIDDHLNQFVDKALEWMLQKKSESLNILSYKLTANAICKSHLTMRDQQLSPATRVCLITALLDLLSADPFLREKLATYNKQLFDCEEVKHHPYYSYLAGKIQSEFPSDDQCEFETSSVDTSFESADTGLFEEEQISVSAILSQLHEEEPFARDFAYDVPDNIYLSGSIEERQPDSVSTQDWERRAYQASQSSNCRTQATSSSRCSF